MLDFRLFRLLVLLLAGAIVPIHAAQAAEPAYGAAVSQPSDFETTMKWHRIAANWDRIADRVAARWDEMSVEGVSQLDGSREQLVRALERSYGITREQAEGEVDRWVAGL